MGLVAAKIMRYEGVCTMQGGCRPPGLNRPNIQYICSKQKTSQRRFLAGDKVGDLRDVILYSLIRIDMRQFWKVSKEFPFSPRRLGA